MTTVHAEKIARRRLSLLQLAQELGNVARACRVAGYNRQHFYEIRRNFQLYGAHGLVDRLPRAKGRRLEPPGIGFQARAAAQARGDRQREEAEAIDEQIRALERFSPEFRERHIEAHYSGDLVAVDTFFVDTLKGVGKLYLQTVLNCFSRHAWGRLYTSELPLTAVQVIIERLHRALPQNASG